MRRLSEFNERSSLSPSCNILLLYVYILTPKKSNQLKSQPQRESSTTVNIGNIEQLSTGHNATNNATHHHNHNPIPAPSHSTKRQRSLSADIADDGKTTEEWYEEFAVETECNTQEWVIDDQSIILPSGVTVSEILKDVRPTEHLRSRIVCMDCDEFGEAFGQDLVHAMAWFQKPASEPELELFFEKIEQVSVTQSSDTARQAFQSLAYEVLSPTGQLKEVGESTQRWLSTALNVLLDRWYLRDLLTIDKGESWYTCALWSPVFDNGIRAVSTEIGINRFRRFV